MIPRRRPLANEGKGVLRARSDRLWRSLDLTGALLAAVCPAAAADSSATVQNAERYLAKGDRNSAEIELGNAVRESPDDPLLRAGLARVYLEEGKTEEGGAPGTRSTGPMATSGLSAYSRGCAARPMEIRWPPYVIQPGDRAPALESSGPPSLR